MFFYLKIFLHIRFNDSSTGVSISIEINKAIKCGQYLSNGYSLINSKMGISTNMEQVSTEKTTIRLARKIIVLNLLNGLQIKNRLKSPAKVNANTLRVVIDCSFAGIIKFNECAIATLNAIIIALGKEFLSTYDINFPSTRESLGCNDKKNAGVPIPTISSIINCGNWKG